MAKAIILYGPSGVGKSTIAEKICKDFDYKHCDADGFKLFFSKERSKIRTRIGEKMGYIYTKELIHLRLNLVIEAIPDKYLKILKDKLKKANYKVIELSLVASLKQCLKNNRKRTLKAYKKEVIEEVYPKHLSKKGIVIDTENKTLSQIYSLVKKSI